VATAIGAASCAAIRKARAPSDCCMTLNGAGYR
jgi:hypothetical protein